MALCRRSPPEDACFSPAPRRAPAFHLPLRASSSLLSTVPPWPRRARLHRLPEDLAASPVLPPEHSPEGKHPGASRPAPLLHEPHCRHIPDAPKGLPSAPTVARLVQHPFQPPVHGPKPVSWRPSRLPGNLRATFQPRRPPPRGSPHRPFRRPFSRSTVPGHVSGTPEGLPSTRPIPASSSTPSRTRPGPEGPSQPRSRAPGNLRLRPLQRPPEGNRLTDAVVRCSGDRPPTPWSDPKVFPERRLRSLRPADLSGRTSSDFNEQLRQRLSHCLCSKQARLQGFAPSESPLPPRGGLDRVAPDALLGFQPFRDFSRRLEPMLPQALLS
jgi:hypothetical protein